MADSQTALYGLVKPEVGASADTWGAKCNQDYDDLDALSGAMTLTGSSSAYVLTTGLSLAAYVANQRFLVKWNHTNGTTPTLNVDGLGAKNIKKRDASTAPSASDLVSGAFAFVAYDGTNFVLLTPVASDFQPLDATLTALAALSYTSGTLIITETASDTFALVSDALYAHLAGTETFSGSKTFSAASAAIRVNNNSFIHLGSSGSRNLLVGSPDGANANWYVYGTGGAYERDVLQCVLSTGVINFTNTPTAGAVAMRVAGKTAVPIPASAMVANTTNGPSAGASESTTNKVMTRTLDFDTTTQEGAQFQIPMPKGWNESTVTFQPLWTAASGSGGVVWELRAVALSDDDAIDTAFGTGQTSTDTFITANDVHIGPESSAITIGNTPAENDMVIFQIRRNVADASDTLGVDAKLLGIRLNITTNAANDV